MKPRTRDPRAVRAFGPPRDEDDSRPLGGFGQLLRNTKAIQPGKLKIEQHDRRSQPSHRYKRCNAVLHRTHNLEPLCLQQRSSRLSKISLVIDNQH
jgi:hypothetical protein